MAIAFQFTFFSLAVFPICLFLNFTDYILIVTLHTYNLLNTVFYVIPVNT